MDNDDMVVTPEPWVRFGGWLSRFLSSYLLTFLLASNFSIPDNMKFGDGQIISIITYSIMFFIGVTTNSTSLFYMIKDRMMKKDRNRMSLLLIHLSIADLLVSY